MKVSVKKLTEYTIYLYILVIMISGSTGSMAVKLVRVVAMAVLMLSFMTEASVKWVKSKFCLWTISFLLYNVVMCLFSFSRQYAVTYTMTLAYVIVIDVFICQYLYRHIEVIPSILKAFILGALMQAMLIYGRNGLLAFLLSRSTEITSANMVGFYSAFATVFSLYFYVNGGRKNRYLVSSALSLVFMILSASRKAFLFLGIPVAFYLIMRSPNPVKIVRNTILIVIAAVVAFIAVMEVPFLYSLVGHRIEEMLNGLFLGGTADASTKTRLFLIEFGMTYFKQRPWFGYGMSNFKELLEVYRGWSIGYYAHNNYVELLVDCGIVGTLIYYSIYIRMLFGGLKAMKRHEPIQVLSLGCLLSFIIGEYGMVTYNIAIYQLLLIVFFFILTDEKDTIAKLKGELS